LKQCSKPYSTIEKTENDTFDNSIRDYFNALLKVNL